MKQFVEIAVLAPTVKSLFHYHLPDGWEIPAPGALVVAPFGAQKVQGVVFREVARPEVPDTRPVDSILDPHPVLTPAQLRLAQWMAEYYRTTLDSCLSAMLPPGLARHAEALYERTDAPFRPEKLVQQRLWKLLGERGPLRSGQIRVALGPLAWEREADRMVRSGWLRRRSVLPPPSVRPKKVRLIQLAVPSSEAQRRILELRSGGVASARKTAFERRARVLESLVGEGKPLAVDWVYASSDARLSDLRWMAEEGWIDLTYEEALRDPLSGRAFPRSAPPVLTTEQESALARIVDAVRNRRSEHFLLWGVTGSGKTEVYLRAVEEAVRRGAQAIVLVPEIALTPQMVQRFGSRFAGRLALIHSRLSAGERYDTWRRARAGTVDVVLGPRSALFAPLPNVGLIVLDEEHDPSYKSGTAPHYHARETALELARLLSAPCLLGSATPDLVSYAGAQSGRHSLLRLTRRVAADMPAGTAPALPPVEIVDMRRELRAGNRSIFSRRLTAALEECLRRKEQAILFLNRRGTASAVVCRSCGQAVACPRCGIALTGHGTALRCHYCNYRRSLPATCPACGSSAIRTLGVGTRRVEEEIRRMFPEARTLCWDRDAVEEAGEHEILLEHFASRRADVLVGTQMIAKGLDLPHVTLVGIVLAELGLLLPDYRSAERVFQLLLQVAGRAGRAVRPGTVVLQTYLPDHYVLQTAAAHDYPAFARIEYEHRRALGYPPYRNLVRLVFVHTNESEAARAAEAMAQTLRARIAERGLADTSLTGPVPCFFEKIAGRHRWQLILRGPAPSSLVELPLPEGCQADVDPVTLL
ncbi:MAG: primosomal protein N' [Anaerolineales bacterium]|nr:primosomal protein N' [Anaerolineales bacterium]